MANELKQYLDETNVLNMIFGDKEIWFRLTINGKPPEVPGEFRFLKN